MAFEINSIRFLALAIPLYDKGIIDKTAEDLGYSQTKVKAQEQTTTPMQLLEMVFSDCGGVLPDMKLSEDDAVGYVKLNTAVERNGHKGWLNIGFWNDAAFSKEG